MADKYIGEYIGEYTESTSPSATDKVLLDIGSGVYKNAQLSKLLSKINFTTSGKIETTNTSADSIKTAGGGQFAGAVKVGAYTLPATDGTENQVLKTDGEGVLTWSDEVDTDTIDVTTIKSKLALTPTKFYDKDDKEIGTLCRAWVNFNGTGTVAIRASFNVTSITDNGTGDYTVNFTNAMPDANYCIVVGGIQDTANNDRYTSAYPVNASSCRIRFGAWTVGLIDGVYIMLSVFK